ncbi:sunset domain-containing protein [Parvimonas sp. C2]|uniref:sunset domain-containing protein n=1 Tax=Parvimonas sp. C2 TaxID=3110692 RepID=UPI002B49B6E8|nr:hypothetical protein [Parvimonas sp. C2]MEB3072655.1 hypothetical protein [Parvimonas sp. C2]
MKKSKTRFLALLLASLIFVSCSSKEKSDQQKMEQQAKLEKEQKLKEEENKKLEEEKLKEEERQKQEEQKKKDEEAYEQERKANEKNSSSNYNNESIEIHANRKSKIYHMPGQAHYNRISSKNLVIFHSEQEAINAGYRKAKK